MDLGYNRPAGQHLDPEDRDLLVTDPIEHAVRRLARRVSIGSVAVFAGVLWRFGLPLPHRSLPWYELGTLITLALVVLGLSVAWRWEGIGGSIALVAGVGAGAIGAVEYHPLIALGTALLFVGPAVLFLIAWHRTRTLASIVVLAVVLIAVMGAGGAVAFDFYEAGFGAAHPQSDTAPPWSSPVVWAWSGGVTTDRSIVVADVRHAQPVRLLVADNPGLEDPLVVEPVVTGTIHRFDVSGLTPGRDYTYGFEIDGSVVGGSLGRFSTWPEGPFSFTVAVGGCSRLHSNGVVYDVIREVEPELFLALGDLYYADIQANSLSSFRFAYETTLTQPAQAAMYRDVPIAYVWDDHDFGPNDADGSAVAAPAALASYRQLVPHYDFALQGGSAPIAQAFTIGRVRFILTDGRTARDSNADTMLGEAQLAWLEGELLKASESHAVVVLATNVPWIAPADPNADDWGGFARERAELAQFIADQGIDNLVMLAGDAHMVAIDDGTNTNFSTEPGPTFPLMHAAALDRPGSEKGGPYSEGAFPGGGQFGLVEVVDDGGPVVTVQLSGWTWESERLTSLTIDFQVDGP